MHIFVTEKGDRREDGGGHCPLFYFFKVSRPVLAKRADIVLGQSVALVDVSAYLANIALFAFGFRLWLYVALIVCVGHRFFIREDSCFAYRADEHSVSVKIHILLYLQRHKGIDVPRQKYKSVVGAQRLATGEFVRVSSA